MTPSRWIMGIISLICLSIVLSLFVGCDSESKAQVKDSATLNFTNTSWMLSAPDANKDKHAHFILGFGWVNDTRAKDSQTPWPTDLDGIDLSIDFHTDWGTFFFFPPVPEHISYEEDGVTKYKWKVELDIGAKNEPSNPIHYHISTVARGLETMTPLPETPDYHDIWLEGSISYVPYP